MDYVDESSELHYSKKQSINIDHLFKKDLDVYDNKNGRFIHTIS
jgi:hypothetical protein